jgi:hypothetical protein
VKRSLAVIAVSAVLFGAAVPASGQETSTPPEAEGSQSVVTTTPAETPSQEAWLQADLEEAEGRSRRTRNAMIGTSVTFGVGVIIAGIGGSQCQEIRTGSQYGDLMCNTAGNVMLPLGITMATLGGIGMLTAGIMLGKSNQRRRQIERDIRRSGYGRRLRWDVPSGALVF